MNMSAHSEAPFNASPEFLSAGFEPLQRAKKRLNPLARALADLERVANLGSQKKVRALQRQLQGIEPSITFIGQVKSGKTTLINTIIGQHGLLPADVNPWTSVVTTLKLTPLPIEPPTSAIFDFFDDDEWDRLISSGGRIGELANRAGADDQIEQVRSQIEAMREKSRRRLGRKFEMLLGSHHQYGYFDSELIERYICLGDNFGEDFDQSDQTGRFADITKSAQLRMRAEHIPFHLSIRDTPGINDTFLMREQITLQSIRESRICVVVLSAHQALSSDDLALIRLITNAKSRDVIIFVNRIDELEAPLQQVEHIKESIRNTLLKHRAPVGIELIFGSALWATSAIKGDIGFLPKDSKSALLNWAESAENRPPASLKPIEMLWHLSGIPKLVAVASQRMSETVIDETTAEILRKVRNMSDAFRVQDDFAEKASLNGLSFAVAPAQFKSQLSAIKTQCSDAFAEELQRAYDEFQDRLDRAADGFLNRATDSLIEHLESYGEQETWTYDPTGLRLLLGSAYRNFERAYLSIHNEFAGACAEQISQLVSTSTGEENVKISIAIPAPIRIPPPIAIGKTIALDLESGWWRSWWLRRKGYDSQTKRFRELIAAEIKPMLEALKQDVRTDICVAGQAALDAFLNEQISLWTEISAKTHLDQTDLSKVLDLAALKHRNALLNRIESNLELLS